VKLPSRRFPRVLRDPRGQGLVELAIMLPVLALLLVFAIDFGRVFFGWVGLQNVVRIGANYAAQHPLADWNAGSTNFDEYQAQIEADAASINCELEDPLPPPSFPNGTGPGDDAVVTITCEFGLITPLAETIVGSPLTIGAEATFPIRAGIVGGGSGGGGGGGTDPALCRVVPDMVNMLVADARDAWVLAGFSGTFSPASGDDDMLVDTQTTTPASVPGECIDFRSTVTVSFADPPTCSPPDVVLPNLVGMTVQDARDRWAVQGFDPANFDPDTGSDGQVVTLQTTTPSVPTGECAAPTTLIVVEFADPPPGPPCLVPAFVGTKKNDAQGTWSGAGFSTSMVFVGGNGNWTIRRQDVEANVWVDCDLTIITVFDS